MNLYEHEGKSLLNTHGIRIPKSILILRNDNVLEKIRKEYQDLSKEIEENSAIICCLDNLSTS